MCVNCAAAGSSYVVGAAAAAKALGPKGVLAYFRPRRWKPREPRPVVVVPPPKREWVPYVVGLASYVAAGVTWPRLLDPVLGPLCLLVAIHIVPARIRRIRAVRRARHAPVAVDAFEYAA